VREERRKGGEADRREKQKNNDEMDVNIEAMGKYII
jgi:hypothetical protein